jgi:hypothetical protein
VGETVLINRDTIKTDYTNPALPDDTNNTALPDGTGNYNKDMPLSSGVNNPHKSSPQMPTDVSKATPENTHTRMRLLDKFTKVFQNL